MATNDVYYTWVESSGDTSYCGGTLTATSCSIWTNWVIDAGTTYTTSSADWIYEKWVTTTENTYIEEYGTIRKEIMDAFHVRTEEEVRAQAKVDEERRVLRDQQQKEYQERMAESKRLAEEAEKKALTLLKEHLDETQAKMFEQHGYIPVITPSGDVYRIEKDGYVHKYDKDGKVLEGLCVVACIQPGMKNSYPLSDVKLMKKLMLESCEDVFRRTANIRRYDN